jgi:hypothetical protein
VKNTAFGVNLEKIHFHTVMTPNELTAWVVNLHPVSIIFEA